MYIMRVVVAAASIPLRHLHYVHFSAALKGWFFGVAAWKFDDMKVVLFCKNNRIQTRRNLCAVFKTLFLLMEMSVSGISVQLMWCNFATKRIDVHVLTSHQITGLVKASTDIPDCGKEN